MSIHTVFPAIYICNLTFPSLQRNLNKKRTMTILGDVGYYYSALQLSFISIHLHSYTSIQKQ